jgi:hypothetical protein
MVTTGGGGACQQRERNSKFLWFCVVHCPKPPLQLHNWLSFGILQDTERFLIPWPRHISSRLPPRDETCKYTTAPITPKNFERFSTYWYAPFCCVCLGCCAAEFGISGGNFELPSIYIPYRTWSLVGPVLDTHVFIHTRPRPVAMTTNRCMFILDPPPTHTCGYKR